MSKVQKTGGWLSFTFVSEGQYVHTRELWTGESNISKEVTRGDSEGHNLLEFRKARTDWRSSASLCACKMMSHKADIF